MAQQTIGDDDFEILNEISSINTQENFEFIEDDAFEMLPCKNKPLSLINSNPITSPVTIIEQPVSIPINIKKSTHLPIQYSSKTTIPHNENIDFKSLFTSRPSYLSNQSNDLLNILKTNQLKTNLLMKNNLQQIVNNNEQNRQSLIQLAKQAQRDFLNAIQLD